MTQLNAKTQAVKDILSDVEVIKASKLDVWVKVRKFGHSRAASNDMRERAFENMLYGWCLYADGHKARFESGIGEDYVLGTYWEAIGHALNDLLNGEVGGIDCGDANAFINAALESEGFKID